MINKYYSTDNGVLHFDGCDLGALATKYGTPLFVYSETDIVERIAELKAAFADKYPGCRAAYASKAFCTKEMLRIIDREGLCVDVVSGGELAVAKAVSFPPERIEFNGNNKRAAEIEDALEYGVGRFIVDGLTELSLIEDACRRLKKRAKVLFRVCPAVAADTHDYIVTGKLDSKFGIPLEDDIFYPLVEQAVRSELVDFMGLHIHIGSQLFDVAPYLKALEVVLRLVDEIHDRFGVVVSELNIGGGFGVTYTDEARKPFSFFLDPVVRRIHDYYTERGFSHPAIVTEPGRSIVGEAGLTLYTVGQIKEIKGVRTYVSIDGGMTDNIRTALYDASYRCITVNRAAEEAEKIVTVCGSCCESGDIIARDVKLPAPETGDIVAVLTTGAYCYAMSSNYNNHEKPAVVMVREGTERLIVQRQTVAQIMENQL